MPILGVGGFDAEFVAGGGFTDCGTIPEYVLEYGGGVTVCFVKASRSELMRLTITIKEVAMAMKVMEAILSFVIGNSLSI